MNTATLLSVLTHVAEEHGDVHTSLKPNADGTWTFVIWSDGLDALGDTFRTESTHETAEFAVQQLFRDVTK